METRTWLYILYASISFEKIGETLQFTTCTQRDVNWIETLVKLKSWLICFVFFCLINNKLFWSNSCLSILCAIAIEICYLVPLQWFYWTKLYFWQQSITFCIWIERYFAYIFLQICCRNNVLGLKIFSLVCGVVPPILI